MSKMIQLHIHVLCVLKIISHVCKHLQTLTENFFSAIVKYNSLMSHIYRHPAYKAFLFCFLESPNFEFPAPLKIKAFPNGLGLVEIVPSSESTINNHCTLACREDHEIQERIYKQGMQN